MAADGRRTASDGREMAFGGRSADRQQRRRKKHLIEAAPFGRLDQMLRTTVQGRVWGRFAPPSQKPGGLGCSAPQPKFIFFRKKLNKKIEKSLFLEVLVP